MEIINIFPTELFTFNNTTVDNADLITKLQHLDNIEIKQSTTLSMLVDLDKNPDFTDLFSWFRTCLEEVRAAMQYDCEKLEITNSWFNVALANHNMYQNYHRHSMSMFSAVYYMTAGSETVFEDPVIHRTQAQIEVLRHNYNPFYKMVPEPGKLVIFPSWLYHRSLPHLENQDRYIISFNSLPTGKINHNLATDSKANIEVKNG